jgi:hypothetical protein
MLCADKGACSFASTESLFLHGCVESQAMVHQFSEYWHLVEEAKMFRLLPTRHVEKKSPCTEYCNLASTLLVYETQVLKYKQLFYVNKLIVLALYFVVRYNYFNQSQVETCMKSISWDSCVVVLAYNGLREWILFVGMELVHTNCSIYTVHLCLCIKLKPVFKNLLTQNVSQ